MLLCEMLENGNENPLVEINLPDSSKIKLRAFNHDSEYEEEAWLVYAGNLDLTGFICDKSEYRAKQVLLDMFARL